MLTNIFRILAHKLEDFTLGTVKKDESMNQSMKRCKVGLIRTSLDKSRTRNGSAWGWVWKERVLDKSRTRKNYGKGTIRMGKFGGILLW
jgi:hypothetical protein